MTLNELIERASQAIGSKGQLAAAMDKHQARISEWVSGKRTPDAHEIAYMAELAGLPVLQTVAEIESQLNGRYASVWRNALGKLTAAGVTATVAAATLLNPTPSNAAPLPSQAGEDVCILC